MDKDIIANMLVSSARKVMLENVDSIDDVKFLQKELKEHLRNEFDLQHQLEEKNKVIDEILNDSWYTEECPIELSDFSKDDERKFNCENCQNDYKKCWLKYFENEILGRGKNGKNNCSKRN